MNLVAESPALMPSPYPSEDVGNDPPLTLNLALGELVPMPRLPEESRRIRSVPDVLNTIG